jgi:hypothetical protein
MLCWTQCNHSYVSVDLCLNLPGFCHSHVVCLGFSVLKYKLCVLSAYYKGKGKGVTGPD